LCILLTGLATSFAADSDGVIATLKNPVSVIRSNAKTGSFLGSISVSDAISVGSDGITIAVLSGNGNVARYDARTGSFQGSISAGAKSTSQFPATGKTFLEIQSFIEDFSAKSG